jgi:alanine racemase
LNLSISNITQILKAKDTINVDLASIDSVSIDSRSLQNGKSTLFFALVGNNNDGHEYIPELFERGVQNFVVAKIPKEYQTKANFFEVENTLNALQDLAEYHRKQFDFPIIGVTGSNGKTIVKEWLTFLLAPDFNIIRSPKSYNSQVGVPLSVLSINENHNLGIFEAGISKVQEMAKLEKIIQPEIGIFTNIGSAHDEGFFNLEEKIKEKMLLFLNAKILVYQKNEVVEKYISEETLPFSWSFSDKNASVFFEKKPLQESTKLQVTYQKSTLNFEIPSIYPTYHYHFI